MAGKLLTIGLRLLGEAVEKDVSKEKIVKFINYLISISEESQ